MRAETNRMERESAEPAPFFEAALSPTSASRYEISRSKALELFAVRGFGQVSMRDLASHLGLAAGSLYHHFPSKQHLLFELLEEFYDDLGTILSDCLRNRKDRARGVQSFIRARLALHKEHPFHGRLVQRDVVSLDDEHRSRIVEMKQKFKNDLMQLLGVSGCEMDAKLEATGHVIAEMVTSLPDWLESYPITENERVRVAERLIMGAVQGMRLQ